MKNKQWMFVMLVVLQTAIYGMGNVVMKLAYEGISPLWCAALRFGIAGAIFLAVFGRRVLPALRAARVRAWLPSSACMAASYLSCSLAVNLTSATNAGFFVALPMLFTPVLGLLVSGSKFGRSTVFLQGVVVAGLYLLCCNGGALTFGLGEAIGLACSAFFAAALVLGEAGLGEVDAIALSTAQIVVTFAGALVAALLFEPVPAFAAVPVASWASIGFLAVFGTALAFFIQNYALGHLPSATISVILCAEPVFTAAISAVALGEVLTGMGVAGAALIVGSTVAASLGENRAETRTPASA